MESIGTRRRRRAAVALKPGTFASQPAANVALLPNERESIAGVLKLKDEVPPGLVECSTQNLYTADSGMDSVKEQRLNPRGQLSQYPVHLKDFND